MKKTIALAIFFILLAVRPSKTQSDKKYDTVHDAALYKACYANKMLDTELQKSVCKMGFERGAAFGMAYVIKEIKP